LRFLAGAMIAVGIIYSLFPAVFAGDLYAYVSYGRLYGLYHVNPYHLTHPLGVQNDGILSQCFHFYGNPPPSDNYGPLWTLLAGYVGGLEAHVDLFFQLWTYRLLGLMGAIASAAGLWRILADAEPARRVKSVSAFAFHPLVLYEAAAGGHNDILMVAPVIWAFAIAESSPLLAGLLMGASVAIKYVSLIVVPFLLIRIARCSGVGTAMAAAVLTAAVPAISFLPFWIGPETLHPLANQLNDYRTSPMWLIVIALFALGRGDAMVTDHISWIRLFQSLVGLIGLAVVASSIFRYYRSGKPAEIFRAIAATVWSSASIYPWYLLWLSPALAAQGRWSRYAFWFCALVFLRYIQDITRQPNTTAAFNLMLVVLAVITAVFLFAPLFVFRRRVDSPASPAAVIDR